MSVKKVLRMGGATIIGWLICLSFVYGENLIKNGDFEIGEGFPSQWFPTGQSQVLSYETQGGKTGNRCLKIENAPGEVTIRQGKWADIPLVSSKQYKLSVYLKTENLSGGGGVTVVNDGWNWSVFPYLKPEQPTTDWVYLEKVFTPGPSANGKYQVIFFTGQSSGKIWADGIKLEEVSSTGTTSSAEVSKPVTAISGTKLTLTKGCYKYSVEPGPAGLDPSYGDEGGNLIDGDKRSSSHSVTCVVWDKSPVDIIVDLQKEYTVKTIVVTESIEGTRRKIGKLTYYTSKNGNEYKKLGEIDNSRSANTYPETHDIVFGGISEAARFIKIQMEKLGTLMDVDEVEIYIEETARTASKEEAKNLIFNPDFEIISQLDAACPDGWKKKINQEGDGVPGPSKPKLNFENDGFSGKKSISISTNTRNDWGSWANNPVSVNPDTEYLLSLYYKYADNFYKHDVNTFTGPAEILVDDNDIYLWERKADGGWIPFRKIIKTKPNTTSLSLGLHLYHRINQRVWFDNISLVEADTLPCLNEPKDKEIIKEKKPVFSWSAVKTKAYVLEYSRDETFRTNDTVRIKTEKTNYEFTSDLKPETWFWRIGVINKEGEICYSVETRSFLIAEPTKTITKDTTPPVILIKEPVPDTTTASDNPQVSVTFLDKDSGIDIKTAKLMIDDKEITEGIQTNPTGLTYLPAEPLSKGIHIATAQIKDNAGNLSNLTKWQFGVKTEISAKVEVKKNQVLVNGLPFFPVGLYVYSPNWKEFAEAGFNAILTSGWDERKPDFFLPNQLKVYLALPQGLNAEMTSLGEDYKQKMAIYNGFKNNACLLGFYYDEPDGNGVPLNLLEQLKTLMKQEFPSHPLAHVFDLPARFAEYASTTDILCTNPYPVCSYPSQDRSASADLLVAPGHLDILKEAGKGEKPLWVIPQAFDYKVAQFGPQSSQLFKEYRPTPIEIRCMTYLLLIHGANGLFYYASDNGKCNIVNFPENWQSLKDLAGELRYLTPVLLSPSIKWKGSFQPENGQVEIMVKTYLDNEYLFAASTVPEPREVTFNLPIKKKPIIKVLFENREIKGENTFTDVFRPFGVHVYQLTY